MVRIEKLYKNFGKQIILDGLDLEIDRKGIIAVLGPNGSGKTTLIKSILGMVVPDKGTISIDHIPIKNSWKYRNQIDYLPQIANFPGNLTVNELLKMIKDLRVQNTRDKELISYFKLQSFLDKKLNNLSGGTKQKVNLVLTFMFDSPLIILDEPTSGLDPVSMLRLKKLLHEEKKRGKTILITSHLMDFVENVADEIVFLWEGKIYFKGSVEDLKMITEQRDFEHAIANLLTEQHA